MSKIYGTMSYVRGLESRAEQAKKRGPAEIRKQQIKQATHATARNENGGLLQTDAICSDPTVTLPLDVVGAARMYEVTLRATSYIYMQLCKSCFAWPGRRRCVNA